MQLGFLIDFTYALNPKPEADMRMNTYPKPTPPKAMQAALSILFAVSEILRYPSVMLGSIWETP